jgi:hypothetical protein
MLHKGTTGVQLLHHCYTIIIFCEVIKVLREFVSGHSSHLAKFPELIYL